MWSLACVPRLRAAHTGQHTPAARGAHARDWHKIVYSAGEAAPSWGGAAHSASWTARRSGWARRPSAWSATGWLPCWYSCSPGGRRCAQRILDSAAQRLGVAPERVVSNLANYGNTSAASIPLALDEAVRSGSIAPGSTARPSHVSLHSYRAPVRLVRHVP